jgi:hypothetical protein
MHSTTTDFDIVNEEAPSKRRRNQPECDEKKPEEEETAKEKFQNTNLLLSYTYFLNSIGTKHVSTGFNCNNLETCFVLRGNSKEIILSCEEWLQLYLNLRECGKKLIKINEEKKINVKVNENELIFYCKKSKVILNKNEWNTFQKYIDILHKYMMYNESAEMIVKSYFKLYTEKCLKKSVNYLDFNDYFIPNYKTNTTVNFSRLFYEIRLFCENKIQNEIFFSVMNWM